MGREADGGESIHTNSVNTTHSLAGIHNSFIGWNFAGEPAPGASWKMFHPL